VDEPVRDEEGDGFAARGIKTCTVGRVPREVRKWSPFNGRCVVELRREKKGENTRKTVLKKKSEKVCVTFRKSPSRQLPQSSF
jgi:hypothetical protein